MVMVERKGTQLKALSDLQTAHERRYVAPAVLDLARLALEWAEAMSFRSFTHVAIRTSASMHFAGRISTNGTSKA